MACCVLLGVLRLVYWAHSAVVYWGRCMAKVIAIRVPEDVSERDVIRWVAEGLSRRLAKKLVLSYLGGRR